MGISSRWLKNYAVNTLANRPTAKQSVYGGAVIHFLMSLFFLALKSRGKALDKFQGIRLSSVLLLTVLFFLRSNSGKRPKNQIQATATYFNIISLKSYTYNAL